MTKKPKVLINKDWTLLVIAAAKGKPLSPVQLQKCLFLLGQEQKQAVGRSYYIFQPLDYGPFCLDIYRDVEELASEELIVIQTVQNRSWNVYFAILTGIERAEELRATLPASVTEYIDTTIKWARNLSFRELIREIYIRYPKFKENSVFQY